MNDSGSTDRRFKNLKDLHVAIFECKECGKIGRNVIRTQPRWDPKRGRLHKRKWGVLIGQAPARRRAELHQEISEENGAGAGTEGRPRRTSPRGKGAWERFEGWLQEAGFSREQLTQLFEKTAVVKCYPGKKANGGDRPPTQRERTLCRHFLEEQIRLLDPQVLVTMGSIALHWFLPCMKLDEAVGKKLRWGHRGLVCFPHASGNNRWLNDTKNKAALARAKKALWQLWQASA
jgi:uracil-DNA glycosylase family 4